MRSYCKKFQKKPFNTHLNCIYFVIKVLPHFCDVIDDGIIAIVT